MRNIDRRELLLSVGGLLAAPLACDAQPADKVRRIGFLSLDTADSEAGRLAQTIFPQALKQLGYIERGNLAIEWRWANGKTADLSELAAELARSKVEIIVARTNAPIQAAMKVTKIIPIVMLNGNFPVEAGSIESLARPGGNVTGTSYWASTEVFGKHLQILKELAPRTVRVAVLRNANFLASPVSQATAASLSRAAITLGVTMHYFDLRQPEEVGAALDAIAASGIKALLYFGDPILGGVPIPVAGLSRW